MDQRVRRRSKERFRSEEPTADDHARYGREDDRAQNSSAPGADHFLDDENYRGNWRIERRRKASRGAHRSDQPDFLARKPQFPSQQRRDSRPHLQRGILGSEGLAAADGQSATDEFPDDGIKRNVPVIHVNGGFGLGDSAAAYARKEAVHQHRDHKPGQRGNQHHARPTRIEGGAEQRDARPVNENAEANHRQAGEKANNYREDQEEASLPEGQHGLQPIQEFPSAIWLGNIQGDLRTHVRGQSSRNVGLVRRSWRVYAAQRRAIRILMRQRFERQSWAAIVRAHWPAPEWLRPRITNAASEPAGAAPHSWSAALSI